MTLLGRLLKAAAAALILACSLGTQAVPYTFKALVIPLSMCTMPPSITSTALDSVLFGKSGYSVESMFEGCSYGNAIFDRQHVTVLPEPVPLPCTGLTDPSIACDYEQWAQAADQWLATNRGGGASDYVHRIYVLPNNIPSCTWGGLGWVGCAKLGTCKLWIKGEMADKAMTYFHELGHNIGLNHANTPSVEYGDSSDAMGLCCMVRCFSAAQVDQLGWAQPSIEIDAASLAPNAWHEYTLSVSTEANALYIRIKGPMETIYAQYRTQQGHDKDLPGTGVFIYTLQIGLPHAPTCGYQSPVQYGWLQDTRQVFRAMSGIQMKLAQNAVDPDAIILVCTGICG
jgi:hypothetical protein